MKCLTNFDRNTKIRTVEEIISESDNQNGNCRMYEISRRFRTKAGRGPPGGKMACFSCGNAGHLRYDFAIILEKQKRPSKPKGKGGRN